MAESNAKQRFRCERCNMSFLNEHGLNTHYAVGKAHRKSKTWGGGLHKRALAKRNLDFAEAPLPRETIETAPPTGLPELPRNFHCVGCGMDLDDYLRAYMLVKRARGQR